MSHLGIPYAPDGAASLSAQARSGGFSLLRARPKQKLLLLLFSGKIPLKSGSSRNRETMCGRLMRYQVSEVKSFGCFKVFKKPGRRRKDPRLLPIP
jgi:hypothetical protein